MSEIRRNLVVESRTFETREREEEKKTKKAAFVVGCLRLGAAHVRLHFRF